MPRMNGFEVIPELQRDHPQVGIVAYTAVAGDFVRREMSRLGIRLLLKSGDAAPLAQALHEAAHAARSRNASEPGGRRPPEDLKLGLGAPGGGARSDERAVGKEGVGK